MEPQVKVLVGRLYEKLSAKGNRYFAGRLGTAEVVMMLDAKADNPDPVWQLFVTDSENGGQRAAGASEAPGQRRSHHSASASTGHASRAYQDHQAPLDHADDMNMPLPPELR